MPLLHTRDQSGDFLGSSSFPFDVTAAKGLKNGHVHVTSKEVTSLGNLKSSPADELKSLDLQPESFLRAVEHPNVGQANIIAESVMTPGNPEESIRIAVQVLEIIETYRSHHTSVPWQGLAGYIALVTEQIRSGEPIRLLFSGFGFKAPPINGKVLGDLPDLGEKLALGHLNGLCSNIAAVYEKGAEVHIYSDGLVYNDLFGVPDEIVWKYGTALQAMAKLHEYQHLRFSSLADVLHHDLESWTKEDTIARASYLRQELRYWYKNTTPRSDSLGDVDSDPTCEYINQVFAVRKDEGHTELLRSMRTRWNAYASALEIKKANYIQLFSPGFGSVQGKNVLTISLIPQGDELNTAAPWNSVVTIELDGRYRVSFASEMRDAATYELVYDATGAPSHYRAKAEMWNWESDGLHVTFEHQYPTGIIIRPTAPYPSVVPSIRDIPMRKVRLLSQTFSPIVLRGFHETTNEDYFLAKGHELGEILTWTFGQILKVKDSGEVDKNANNVTSNEAMPMHFDGIFKFVDKVDPDTGIVKRVLTPPRYQYFTCLSTAPKGDGYTLFANSRLFFQYLPAPFTVSRLEKATWSMVNDGFWSAKQTDLPLVVRHEETGAACLRWHEPWTKTKFSKYYIEIENDDAAEELVEVVNKLLYDFRVCLRFEWEQGDLLVNDNVSMLHTRTAFVGDCEREMWRIHFD